MTQVSFVDGKTRIYAIIGDPIKQVRSPEMVTWEFHQRGVNALVIPMHLRSADFESALPSIMTIQNLDGLIFTIPFKARAMAFAQKIGPQAQQIGAFNAMARRREGHWVGEMFDGLGCIEAFRRRGYDISDKNLMLIGLGGAGAAIAAALAGQNPRRMRIYDLDAKRCESMAQRIGRINPAIEIEINPPRLDDIDILLNATPVGMLSDARLPFEVERFNPELIVFDAVVKPEQTPLLSLAESCDCRIVRGREMMLGQVAKIVDFFTAVQV